MESSESAAKDATGDGEPAAAPRTAEAAGSTPSAAARHGSSAGAEAKAAATTPGDTADKAEAEVIFGAVDTDTALNQPASSRPNELKNPSLAMRTSVQSRPSIQVLADRLAARSAAQATDSERFFPRGEVGASKERHAAAANAARLAPTTGWQTAQGSVPNATPPMASANPHGSLRLLW